MKARRNDLQALDSAQHGDGGRDHAVAVEHRGAENAETAGHERSQRENASFTTVVRTHDQRHVFQRDDDHQRPEQG